MVVAPVRINLVRSMDFLCVDMCMSFRAVGVLLENI